MKSKLKLFAIVLTLLCVFALSACSTGEKSLNDLLNEHNIKSTVTYYAGGGTFDGTNNLTTKTLYYKENASVLNIGETQSSITIDRTNYVFNGWYRAKTDGEGNILYADEAKTIPQKEDEPLSFPVTIPSGENWHLVADWVKDVCIEFILVSDFTLTIDGVEYNNGEVISEWYFGKNSSLKVPDNNPITGSKSINGTYLQTYAESTCTTPFTSTVNKPTNGENYKLYTKFLEGKWTVVKNKSGAEKMIEDLGDKDKKFYVFSDIDCEGASVSALYDFAATIEGNGHTISNFTIKLPQIKNGFNKAAFGELGSTANINELTFSQVTVTGTIANGIVNVYGLFSSYEEGAVFNNFTIDGLKLEISKAASAMINNIQYSSDAYETDNWIFGGCDTNEDGIETDAEFMALYSGITVTNSEFEIK